MGGLGGPVCSWAPRPADQVHLHLDTRHGEGLGPLQPRGVQEGQRPLGP